MSNTSHQYDAIILGGGIAGLWTLSLLRRQGYNAILVEKEALGSGQTFASQGMIHGGVKYSLKGALTGASESIADMPARWRDCLSGKDAVDLRGVKVLSDAYYLFSDSRLSSRLTAFIGSKAIEGRVSPVSASDYPIIFQSPFFKGLLYKLNDLVLDTRSLVTHLRDQNKDHIYTANVQFEQVNGAIKQLCLGDGLSISADTYILAAGKGNGEIVRELGLESTMQLRPLHQVVVTGENLPDLYAHAVTLRTSDKPRITFTTHAATDTKTSLKTSLKTWYLGGQLAETGVERSEQDQIDFAKKELAAILPWQDFSDCQFGTFRIDRAESGQSTLLRPDTPYVGKHNNVVLCWPTKLTLAPMMGDMLMKLMPSATAKPSARLNLPEATLGATPWG